MRIGIWCDYGFTLEPSEGIGVFVDNLARALVRADQTCELVLMSHWGEEGKLASLVKQGKGRISVVSVPKLSRWRRAVIRGFRRLDRLCGRYAGARHPTLKAACERSLRTIRQAAIDLAEPRNRSIEAHKNGCDMWLLPHVGLEQDFVKPTVVVVHDLVCYHFPDMLTPSELTAFKKVVDKVVGRATLAACMSDFIRDNDLLGTLGLPQNRVRVVKAAVPDDFGFDTLLTEEAAESIVFPDGIASDTPFLFYPAAFRTYKNHRYLVDVLRRLKDRSRTPWKLVFTGIQSCDQSLSSHIDDLGLTNDVIILGKVSRAELVQWYLSAFATVVPSLYEQGSFPVMEALQCRCPAAASNIPSLQEQFASMGESMLYFDPYDPQSLVEIIESIASNREQMIESQSEGFRTFRQNSWEKAAAGWLAVFREAIEMGDRIEDAFHFKRAA